MEFLYLRFLIKAIKGSSLMFSMIVALGFIRFSRIWRITFGISRGWLTWPIALDRIGCFRRLSG